MGEKTQIWHSEACGLRVYLARDYKGQEPYLRLEAYFNPATFTREEALDLAAALQVGLDDRQADGPDAPTGGPGLATGTQVPQAASGGRHGGVGGRGDAR